MPNQSPCPSSEQLGDFVAGELVAPEHDKIDSHLDGCDRCQTEVDRLGRDTLLDSLPRSSPPPDIALAALMERAKQLGSGSGVRFAEAAASQANQSQQHVLQTGDQLGEYEVVQHIGSGGMGQVYLATHRRMQRQVAIKMLAAQWSHTDQGKDRFQREIEAIAKLDHPNIVTAHDAGEAHGHRYLVMEYVDGETLHARLKRGPLPPEEVVDAGRQIASSLVAAHEAGLIHRDVKPSNLIRDARGVVKLLDLGLVRALSETPGEADLTDSQHCMGTADYMAPEQAINPRQAGELADVYSLGCTLFHLLEGEKPFAGETPMEVIIAHREQPVAELTRGGAPLTSLIREMMAKEPEDRPAMPQVLDRLLELPDLSDPLAASEGRGDKGAAWFWTLGAALTLLVASVLMWPAPSSPDAKPTGASPRPEETAASTTISVPKIEVVSLKPGLFQMGSPEGHPRASVDEQLHAVELTRPFAIGKFEVTVAQWRAVMGEEPPTDGKEPPAFHEAANRKNLPVQGVRWLQAIEFCNALSQQSGFKPFYDIEGSQVKILGGDGYRLPTEAEWEYACRAGTSGQWHFGEDAKALNEFAWHAGNTKHRQPVGEKSPNPWGLYDMHGNVAEWCWDRYDPDFYRKSPAFDPVGSGEGPSRVFRGGAWYDHAPQTRSAARGAMLTTYGRYQPIGFRVARSL